MSQVKPPMIYPETPHADPQEDNRVLGNQFYGPTGANNDAKTPTVGDTLEGLTMGAPTTWSGGVPSIGQQAPISGYGVS